MKLQCSHILRNKWSIDFDDSTNSHLICIATKHLNWYDFSLNTLLNIFRVLDEQTTFSLSDTACHSWLLNTIKQCRKRHEGWKQDHWSSFEFFLCFEVGWKAENGSGDKEIRCLSNMYIHPWYVEVLKMFCSINHTSVTILGNKIGWKLGKNWHIPMSAPYNMINDLCFKICI